MFLLEANIQNILKRHQYILSFFLMLALSVNFFTLYNAFALPILCSWKNFMDFFRFLHHQFFIELGFNDMTTIFGFENYSIQFNANDGSILFKIINVCHVNKI